MGSMARIISQRFGGGGFIDDDDWDLISDRMYLLCLG